MDTRYLCGALLVALSPAWADPQPITHLDPIQTLQRINRNYNTVTDACREPDTLAPRGHYYCSGVTLRMVDDGNFNPWDYSPFAVKTGATSFSWIRRDLSTSRLIRPAGYILRTPMDARELGLPVMEKGFVCIYSFDGFTGPERKWYGCGRYGYPLPANHLKNSATSPPNRNAALAYGNCDTRGVDTAQQWRKNYRYARNDMNRIQVTQCSWNAEQPSDWNAMIGVHENPRTIGKDTFARKELFNEFLLSNVEPAQQQSPDDGSARLPYIDAVVWDVNSTYVANTRGDVKKPKPTKGLEPARSFQRKLYAQGYAVPILRLNFNKPAAQRFGFVEQDQVVPLGAKQASADGYIESAQWLLRLDPGSGRQEWTLKVVPTSAGTQAQSTLQQAIYDELQALRGQDPQWRENERSPGSMRQQLECLVSNYPEKKQWNLEPFRPTVSADDAAKAHCNPVLPVTSELIERSSWNTFTDRSSGKVQWGLQVIPTRAGRSAPNEALYQELVRLRGDDIEWKERAAGSMRAQLACLQNNFRSKAQWHLEPHRPAVSAEKTKAHGCNPT